MVLAHDLRFLKILEKILAVSRQGRFLVNWASGNTAFGIPLNVRSTPVRSDDYLTLRFVGGSGIYPRHLVTRNADKISQWKVVTSLLLDRTTDYPRMILKSPVILSPDEICNDSYIVIGFLKSEEDAMNMVSYLNTKFVQFLIMAVSTRAILTKDNLLFVPVQNWGWPWSDDKLYAKYKLSPEDIAFIETYATVRN